MGKAESDKNQRCKFSNMGRGHVKPVPVLSHRAVQERMHHELSPLWDAVCFLRCPFTAFTKAYSTPSQELGYLHVSAGFQDGYRGVNRDRVL